MDPAERRVLARVKQLRAQLHEYERLSRVDGRLGERAARLVDLFARRHGEGDLVQWVARAAGRLEHPSAALLAAVRCEADAERSRRSRERSGSDHAAALPPPCGNLRGAPDPLRVCHGYALEEHTTLIATFGLPSRLSEHPNAVSTPQRACSLDPLRGWLTVFHQKVTGAAVVSQQVTLQLRMVCVEPAEAGGGSDGGRRISFEIVGGTLKTCALAAATPAPGRDASYNPVVTREYTPTSTPLLVYHNPLSPEEFTLPASSSSQVLAQDTATRSLLLTVNPPVTVSHFASGSVIYEYNHHKFGCAPVTLFSSKPTTAHDGTLTAHRMFSRIRLKPAENAASAVETVFSFNAHGSAYSMASRASRVTIPEADPSERGRSATHHQTAGVDEGTGGLEFSLRSRPPVVSPARSATAEPGQGRGGGPQASLDIGRPNNAPNHPLGARADARRAENPDWGRDRESEVPEPRNPKTCVSPERHPASLDFSRDRASGRSNTAPNHPFGARADTRRAENPEWGRDRESEWWSKPRNPSSGAGADPHAMAPAHDFHAKLEWRRDAGGEWSGGRSRSRYERGDGSSSSPLGERRGGGGGLGPAPDPPPPLLPPATARAVNRVLCYDLAPGHGGHTGRNKRVDWGAGQLSPARPSAGGGPGHGLASPRRRAAEKMGSADRALLAAAPVQPFGERAGTLSRHPESDRVWYRGLAGSGGYNRVGRGRSVGQLRSVSCPLLPSNSGCPEPPAWQHAAGVKDPRRSLAAAPLPVSPAGPAVVPAPRPSSPLRGCLRPKRALGPGVVSGSERPAEADDPSASRVFASPPRTPSAAAGAAAPDARLTLLKQRAHRPRPEQRQSHPPIPESTASSAVFRADSHRKPEPLVAGRAPAEALPPGGGGRALARWANGDEPKWAAAWRRECRLSDRVLLTDAYWGAQQGRPGLFEAPARGLMSAVFGTPPRSEGAARFLHSGASGGAGSSLLPALPMDVVLLIFKHLPPGSICSAASASVSWRAMAVSIAKKLSRDATAKDYPPLLSATKGAVLKAQLFRRPRYLLPDR
ncbi:hypothetical protein DIPPA_29404 [Diplonema papillatum]|nr:hypothetical protein DIPPA_29404 [Diplonema papillatum]|eukprot:gene8779-13603_t